MRLSILTFLAWIVAVFVSLVAWGIGLNALGTTLQDMRPYQMNLPDGWVRHSDDTWNCIATTSSPAFIIGESYWHYPCIFWHQDKRAELFAVRFSPATGQMDWLWHIPGDSARPNSLSDIGLDNTVFLPNTDGTLFLYAWYQGRGAESTDEPKNRGLLLYPDGRVEVLPLQSDFQILRGASWVADGIQFVSVPSQLDDMETIYSPAVLTSWSAATGASSKVVPQPEGCANCRLQIAYRLEAGWRLIYADMAQLEPANINMLGATLPLSALYMTDETGARLPLVLPTNQVNRPDADTLIWFPTLFDSSIANVPYIYNDPQWNNPNALRMGVVPYYFTGDSWALTSAPPQNLLDALGAGQLLSTQTFSLQFQTSMTAGSWAVTYESQRLEDTAITHVNGQWASYRYREPVLSFATEAQPQLRPVGIGGWRLIFGIHFYVIPQADGGYWLSSVNAVRGGLPYTQFYLDIGPDLERRNTPSLVERILLRFDDYATNPVRFRDRSVAFFLPLIGLPLLLIGGLVLRQRAVRKLTFALLLVYSGVLILTLPSLNAFFGTRL